MVPVGAIVVTVACAVEDPRLRAGFLYPQEGAPLLCEVVGCLVGMQSNKSHELIGNLKGLVGFIHNAELNQQIGEAHDAETDLLCLFGMGLDRRQRKTGSIERIIEEPNCERNDGCKPIIVDCHTAAVRSETSSDVDRTERTGLMGKKRLLAAGVGGLDRPKMRGGIRAVDGVEEENAWFPGLSGGCNEPVEDHRGRETTNGLCVPWVDEGIRPVPFDCLHETVGETDGEIEVRHFAGLLLQGDEIQDVGMVDSQDAHVGAPPGPS